VPCLGRPWRHRAAATIACAIDGRAGASPLLFRFWTARLLPLIHEAIYSLLYCIVFSTASCGSHACLDSLSLPSSSLYYFSDYPEIMSARTTSKMEIATAGVPEEATGCELPFWRVTGHIDLVHPKRSSSPLAFEPSVTRLSLVQELRRWSSTMHVLFYILSNCHTFVITTMLPNCKSLFLLYCSGAQED
jgi:hypothetical protein